MIFKKTLLITLVIIFLIVGLSFRVCAAFTESGAALSPDSVKAEVCFSDVPANHWAYNMITDMVKLKAVSGYPDEMFRPERIVTRAEFAVILAKTVGLQVNKVATSSFKDVKPADWYSSYIETTKDYLTGYRDPKFKYNFNPNAPALREDVVMAIVKLKGYDINLANKSIIEAMFSDFEGISEIARDYVAVAVEKDLVSGNSNGTFKPQSPITRAEVTVLLWRSFMQNMEVKKGGINPQPSTPVDTESGSELPSSRSQGGEKAGEAIDYQGLAPPGKPPLLVPEPITYPTPVAITEPIQPAPEPPPIVDPVAPLG